MTAFQSQEGLALHVYGMEMSLFQPNVFLIKLTFSSRGPNGPLSSYADLTLPYLPFIIMSLIAAVNRSLITSHFSFGTAHLFLVSRSTN